MGVYKSAESMAGADQAPTKTAEESIAAAKRELASYKQVKHEAAIRAVTAAKRALNRGIDTSAEAEGAEAAMAGVLRYLPLSSEAYPFSLVPAQVPVLPTLYYLGTF